MTQFLNYIDGRVFIATYRDPKAKVTTFDDCRKAIVNRTEEDLVCPISEGEGIAAEELCLLGKDEFGYNKNYSSFY